MMEQERPEQPEDEFFVHDDTHEQAPQEAEGDDLDGMRIRQIAARRRSAYRSRSYCIVAAVGMIVAAGQLGYLAVREIRGDGWGALAVGYLLFAVLCPMVAVRFWRKAREYGREAAKSGVGEAAGEPDFGPLSDGSQRWKNLGEMGRGGSGA